MSVCLLNLILEIEWRRVLRYGTARLEFKSRAVQTERSVASRSRPLRYFFERSLMLADAMSPRLVPQTCCSFKRNSARTMND